MAYNGDGLGLCSGENPDTLAPAAYASLNRAGHARARCAIPGCERLRMNERLPFCSHCWHKYTVAGEPMPGWMRFLKQQKDREMYAQEVAWRYTSLEEMFTPGDRKWEEVVPYRGINVVTERWNKDSRKAHGHKTEHATTTRSYHKGAKALQTYHARRVHRGVAHEASPWSF